MIKLRNLIGAVSVALLLAACGGQSQKQTDGLSGTLAIFHAGSLSLPMKAAADSFMRMHPNVTINLEAAGSVECARKITELNRPCDV
ncbi:MAG TPA: substrate-binding domain-containing protein, partial [Tenuifilaceae bacterium]|nr:substrate-binding domain-containing protein [Tenuifilaceae bacterium]